MAREPRQASAADVRQWALDENWSDSNGNGVGERGRFSSELVEAFNKAHRRNNTVYAGGGVSGNTSGNSRSTSASTRTTTRASNSSQGTRRAPSSAPQRQTSQAAPAPRQQRQGDLSTAVITPSGTGMSQEQMEQFSRLLADANAVTGIQNELTIIRIAPAVA